VTLHTNFTREFPNPVARSTVRPLKRPATHRVYTLVCYDLGASRNYLLDVPDEFQGPRRSVGLLRGNREPGPQVQYSSFCLGGDQKPGGLEAFWRGYK
jgi:hypothetical protein